MRPSDRWHLVELMATAERGQLSRSDVVALFMLVRGEAPKNSVLRDIGDTVAHDERDRGVALRSIDAFIEHTLEVFRAGGMWQIDVLFEVHALLDELLTCAALLQVPADHDKVHSNSDRFALALADVLDGTTFLVKRQGTHVAFEAGPPPSVVIRVDDDHTPPPGVITWPPGVALSFPLLIQR